MRTYGLLMAAVVLVAVTCAYGDVTLVKDGQSQAVICAPATATQPDDPKVNINHLKNPAHEDELQRRLLRESVKDLAAYLEKMSGAKVEIVTEVPKANDPRTVILIGAMGAKEVKAPRSYPFKQGFRYIVSDKPRPRVVLCGESDLATSYAIYELLDRLGCRWYMPSDKGECIPQRKTIELAVTDESLAPATVYRGIWYCDEAYRRRNRMGGLCLSAGHALEITGAYLTAEDKKAHPEWLADIDGKKDDTRLKWSNKAVADFIADKIIAMYAANPQPSYSLSPNDGDRWDNSPEDKALDAGDFDMTFQQPAITDRYMVLCNRIAARVAAKCPDTLLGFLAYVQYTRPPLREPVAPNLVPEIAPITYSRAHPMSMDEVPGNKDLSYIVQGWGKKARQTSYYFYGYFLAETSAPFPMLRKWGNDVPFVLKNGNCKFWQPETMPNFDSAMHALYMANRLAWDPNTKPQDVYDQINRDFYGSAAKEMAEYWDFIDRCWVDTPEYSGSGFGHMRRFTPERLAKARELMTAAQAAAKTDLEKFRIGIAADSLAQLEAFMKLRRDLAEGRFADLATGAEAWKKQARELGEKYKPQSAFTWTGWAPNTVNAAYFSGFYGATYQDAARLAKEYVILTSPPLRQWKYLADPDKQGEKTGWAKPDFNDGEWKSTDVAVETWSSIGRHDYKGSMWYRRQVQLPKDLPAGKKVYLWLGSTDGSVKVFVNGKHVPYVQVTKAKDGSTKSETLPEATGYCQPFSFDITSALNADGNNTIAILADRTAFNELGTGGLLAAPVVYREK